MDNNSNSQDKLPRINLCGSFVARSSRCKRVSVWSVYVEAGGERCDVHVSLATADNEGGELVDDDLFLVDVNQALAEAGYHGPDLSSAERSVQFEDRVVLEATYELQDWALQRGWQPNGGADAIYAGRMLRTIPSESFVTFLAPSGDVLGVPLWWVAERKAKQDAAHAGGMAAVLQEQLLPALRRDIQLAAKWLRSMDWEEVKSVVQVVNQAPEHVLRDAFFAAELRVSLKSKRWRDH